MLRLEEQRVQDLFRQEIRIDDMPLDRVFLNLKVNEPKYIIENMIVNESNINLLPRNPQDASLIQQDHHHQHEEEEDEKIRSSKLFTPPLEFTQ